MHWQGRIMRALSDDTLKDAANLAFLDQLPPTAQRVWRQRARWLRTVDQLAENQLLQPEVRRFDRFVDTFRCLGESDELALQIRFSLSPIQRDAFDLYLEGLYETSRYRARIDTIDQHDAMLRRVSHLFAVLPDLDADDAALIVDFGALDMAYNNLRDVDEDLRHGVCHFPADALARFGLDPTTLHPGRTLSAFLRWWVAEQLPVLRGRATPFLRRLVHPSVAAMRDACLARYGQIEHDLRAAQYDPSLFSVIYWERVRRALTIRTAA
jgi:hypothetical protein